MKNLYLLDTDKPSRLRYNLSNVLVLIKDTYRVNYDNEVTQHIYITSDEEIKEGDFGYNFISGTVDRITDSLLANKTYYKKIILTTDQDLIKDGVQPIDDEFLEWFVKNPSCESVEIERNFADEGVKGITHYGKYFLIIPKEEPKQETQGYICPQTKIQCDDECCVSAENCHIESSKVDLDDYANGLDYAAKWYKYNFIEGAKQETLEEAAERYLESKDWRNGGSFNQLQNIFTEGAKWQQERMYSEEEVLELILKSKIETSNLYYEDMKEWFKQFKKIKYENLSIKNS